MRLTLIALMTLLAAGCAARDAAPRFAPARDTRIPLPEQLDLLVGLHLQNINDRGGRGVREGYLLLVSGTDTDAAWTPEDLVRRVAAVVYHTAPGPDGRVTSFVGLSDGSVQTAQEAAKPEVIGLGPYQSRGIVHAYELARIRPERFVYPYRLRLAVPARRCTIDSSFRIERTGDGLNMYLSCLPPARIPWSPHPEPKAKAEGSFSFHALVGLGWKLLHEIVCSVDIRGRQFIF